tara:strand:+ start:236 stop:571 length:336 start_codon:yes stop_codon:yes gene_type:complete
MAVANFYWVKFINSDVEVAVKIGETIYSAALKAGLQLPIGCNYGGCITCAAKLLSGKVKQPGATALNRRQSKANYILLCVSQPESDCTISEGVISHDKLYQNPFLSLNRKR